MYNDTKTIYSKKIYTGMQGYKKMYVELEINQEAETRQKLTTTLQPISGYKTLSICGNGGQNIEEIGDINKYTQLFISEDDLKTIVDIWERWHLNDMNAGTIQQQTFIDDWKQTHKYDYTAASEALKNIGLYEDNGYKYGSAWLVNPLPEKVINTITAIFDKYNNSEHINPKTDTVIFENFKVKVIYKGDKAASWNKNNYNNYLVTVINTQNKQRCTFEFWASMAHPEIGTEQDILGAFSCFVGDAISGNMNFEEFCSEFGYDEDSRKAEKTWKACQRSTAKLQRIYDGNIYDLANKLQEAAE